MIKSKFMEKDIFGKPVITLTTDFGSRDGFVGVMKGVILGINPDVHLVDISHQISPQDIRSAAFVLQSAIPYFPPDTIHVVVVDPGVGSERNVLAARTNFGIVLVPDNGILSLISNVEISTFVMVDNRNFFLPQVSNTFHGRDVFAPVAGHLSKGLELGALGPTTTIFRQLEPLIPSFRDDGIWMGHVRYIDRFGNLITNLARNVWTTMGRKVNRIGVGDHSVTKVSPYYADVQIGALVAVWGSHGYLEIALNGANASRRLGVQVGDQIWIETSEVE